MERTGDTNSESDGRKVIRDFGRAAGGALLFSLPMLMTMEMWEIGTYLDRTRLLVLVATCLPLLIFLSRQIGFESTGRWLDDVLDSAIALGIGTVVSVGLLALFGIVAGDSGFDVAAGKTVVQVIPAAIGALLARSQLSAGSPDREQPVRGYGGEMFLMGVGALFLAFNVAPTEEMILISYLIGNWQVALLVLLSLIVMHGFAFAVDFAGGTRLSKTVKWWAPLVRLTLPGYAIAFSVSLYLLWIFARTDGHDFDGIVKAAAVLAFPSAIGAASARLVL